MFCIGLLRYSDIRHNQYVKIYNRDSITLIQS